MTILGIFPCKMKDIIFAWQGACEVRLNPHEVRMKQTSESKNNSENSKCHFGWRVPLLTIPDQLILSAILYGSHHWEMSNNWGI